MHNTIKDFSRLSLEQKPSYYRSLELIEFVSSSNITAMSFSHYTNGHRDSDYYNIRFLIKLEGSSLISIIDISFLATNTADTKFRTGYIYIPEMTSTPKESELYFTKIFEGKIFNTEGSFIEGLKDLAYEHQN